MRCIPVGVSPVGDVPVSHPAARNDGPTQSGFARHNLREEQLPAECDASAERSGCGELRRVTRLVVLPSRHDLDSVGLHPDRVAALHLDLGKKTTPAMAAGITTYPWSLTQLAELLD